MTLEFLCVDTEGTRTARSPMADQAVAAGARFETRDGWEVAVSFGDPVQEAAACAERVGFADVSHLGKLEVHTPPGQLGTAVRREDHWWCPVTPERALAVSDAHATPRLRDRYGALDLTTSYGAMVIAGPLARETFARFCALDLREHIVPVCGFRPGSVARTPGFVLREAPQRYLVLFGAAYGAYFWEMVADTADRLGGRPVGVDALPAIAPVEEEETARA